MEIYEKFNCVEVTRPICMTHHLTYTFFSMSKSCILSTGNVCTNVHLKGDCDINQKYNRYY